MVEILPTKLKKEPIVDAVFEIRFKSVAPVSMILPGVFFSRLDGEKTLSELPAAQIPKHVRDIDPNLQFAPTQQIQWNGFVISFSDKSIVIVITSYSIHYTKLYESNRKRALSCSKRY